MAESGDEEYANVLNAMIYTIAKQIGAMYVTMEGEVDAIILTGGIAHSKYCMALLEKRISFLGKVVVMPGENEIESLAYNAFGVLKGEIQIKEYN